MTSGPDTILITGASGFVGGHLLPALEAAFPDTVLATPSIELQDSAQVEQVVHGTSPDVCIHLAAVSAIDAAREVPEHAWNVNFHGTLNLAWALSRHAPACQMLFVSSADAYGASFNGGDSLDERAPLAPISVYAQTKAAADLLLGGMAAQGLRVVRLRPFNHIGPGQSAAFVVASFARQIARIAAGLQPPWLEVGNLETWRDFLDVRDVCAAYIACITHRNRLAPGTILNVASGQARRVGDVLTELAALAGVELGIKIDESRIRATDIRRACGNASRAHELLDWSPTIPWAQTLQDVFIDWRGRVTVERI
jgi:GDP-4-dehydro-6-deoxy-D-mannose reductase